MRAVSSPEKHLTKMTIGGEKMKRWKKILLATLTTLAIIQTITLSLGIIQVIMEYPTNATPTGPTNVSLIVFLDEGQGAQIWQNGTIIDFGNVTAGQIYEKTLIVQNNGDVPFICRVFADSGLPATWNYSWTGNNTQINVGTQLSGLLTLTTPDPMTETTPQSWTTTVVADVT